MTIKKKEDLDRGREIDLTGPQGNAFCLLGQARVWAEQLDKDADAIVEEMKSGNYEHLVKVFDREFGHFVTLLR